MRNVESSFRLSAALVARIGLCLVCATSCFVSTSALGDEIAYTGREFMIPMRDGVELYTQVFEPVDGSGDSPILFRRTPYRVPPMPERVDPRRLGPSPLFSNHGYIFVRQDVRGQFRSEGEWRMLLPPRADKSDPHAVDETTDAYDTIEWLVQNLDGHNGRVGMWGISYDAWETVMAMVDAHPSLVAASPQASPADEFVGDDMHHNGAFRLSYTFAWIAFMAANRGDADPGRVGQALRNEDSFEFFRTAGSLRQIEGYYFQGNVPDWDDVVTHGDYDEYWKRRNVLSHLSDVRPAVLNVAGWFDAEDFRGPIDIYHEVEKNDAEDKNTLVVGPWDHGGWSAQGEGVGESLGDLHFGAPTSHWYQEEVELRFFEVYLRETEEPFFPEVIAFETGANTWHELEHWPPADVESRPLYLHGGGVASFDAPRNNESYSEFKSNPSDPVPYTAKGPVFPDGKYMVEDQRYLEGRTDVLSFVTEPLTEDLVIAGRVGVDLHFSTTGTDADWIVKLIDVFPEDAGPSAATGRTLDNAEIILSGEIFRAKYRNSFEEPQALEPETVTQLTFFLPDRFHRFLRGHRLMVQIHSTWFPMYDRNPQAFTDIYAVEEEDYSVETHRVFHQEGTATRLRLPVFTE